MFDVTTRTTVSKFLKPGKNLASPFAFHFECVPTFAGYLGLFVLLSLHFACRLIWWRFKVGQKSLFLMRKKKTAFIKIILIFCSVLAFIYQSTADSEQIQPLVSVLLHPICIKLRCQCLIIGRRHNWADGSSPCMTDFQQATLAFSLKSSSCLTYKHEQHLSEWQKHSFCSVTQFAASWRPANVFWIPGNKNCMSLVCSALLSYRHGLLGHSVPLHA